MSWNEFWLIPVQPNGPLRIAFFEVVEMAVSEAR
jgi:hypothetical protein